MHSITSNVKNILEFNYQIDEIELHRDVVCRCWWRCWWRRQDPKLQKQYHMVSELSFKKSIRRVLMIQVHYKQALHYKNRRTGGGAVRIRSRKSNSKWCRNWDLRTPFDASWYVECVEGLKKCKRPVWESNPGHLRLMFFFPASQVGLLLRWRDLNRQL